MALHKRHPSGDRWLQPRLRLLVISTVKLAEAQELGLQLADEDEFCLRDGEAMDLLDDLLLEDL